MAPLEFKDSSDARVLIIDDDQHLTAGLREYLTGEGFGVETCSDGSLALVRLVETHFDIVILDVMMPGLSGLEVLKYLRASHSIPVLMLTARGDYLDRVLGLELGADDYLSKPFNPRELVARIRAILRRTKQALNSSVPTKLGDLLMDRANLSVSFNNEPLHLTMAEFLVLEVLVRGVGNLQTRSSLTKRALGRELEAYDRSIDMHVSNLRRKLGTNSANRLEIKSVRGAGYVLTMMRVSP